MSDAVNEFLLRYDLVDGIYRIGTAIALLGVCVLLVNWTLEDMLDRLDSIDASLRRLAPPPSRDGAQLAPNGDAAPTAAEVGEE